MEEESRVLLKAVAFEVGRWLIGFVAGCAARVRSVLGRVEIGEKIDDCVNDCCRAA